MPGFITTGMENAGLVIMMESYLVQNDEEEYLDFAMLIIHELSHHWFGNVVSIKWWDDLWLNESFANYMEFFVLRNLSIESK